MVSEDLTDVDLSIAFSKCSFMVKVPFLVFLWISLGKLLGLWKLGALKIFYNCFIDT